jgi:hypothetical protein
MVLEPLLSSLYKWLKTNHRFPLSAIRAIPQRHDSAGEEPSLEGGVSVADEQIPEVAEDNSRELEDEVASKATTTIMIEEDEAVRVVDGDLAGRIMTSRNETAMRLLTSSLTGRCWRRLISIVWLS